MKLTYIYNCIMNCVIYCFEMLKNFLGSLTSCNFRNTVSIYLFSIDSASSGLLPNTQETASLNRGPIKGSECGET